MANTATIYTWKQLDIAGMTSMYLFGELTKPDNIATDQWIRPKDTSKPVVMDAITFMSSGPGRFANASKIPVVNSFMVGFLFSPNGTKQTFTWQQATSAQGGKSANTDLLQSNYQDGIDDHALRTYIYQTSGFTLSKDALFVIEADGTRHIENLAVLPFDDNFDFESDSISSAVGNKYLEPRIDPTKIGRKVLIEFDTTSKQAISRVNYSQQNYQSDLLRFEQVFSPISGNTALLAEMPQVVADLWNKGVTKLLDQNGRAVLHGTDDSDTRLNSSMLDNTSVYAPLRTALNEKGIALIGGRGDDLITGNKRNDHLNGGDGDDTLAGGDANDTLVDGKGTDTYQFEGKFGNDSITDSDGVGKLTLDGQTLTGGKKLSSAIWLSDDKKTEFHFQQDSSAQGAYTGQGTLRVFRTGRPEVGAGITARGWKLGEHCRHRKRCIKRSEIRRFDADIGLLNPRISPYDWQRSVAT